MKKSLSKRIRITRGGKILRRATGIDHFRTRKSPKRIRRMQKSLPLHYPKKKIVNY